MIEAAERDGLIEPGRTTIVEATSGNTGIALAFVCAAKGYDLRIFLPQGMSREREALLRLYGARVQVVESMGGMNEAVRGGACAGRGARPLPARPVLEPGEPGGPPPHDRPGDPRGARRARRRLVAGVGTGGTITGAGEAILKAVNPDALLVARRAASLAPCCPAAPPGPHRIQGIGAGFVPAVLNRELIDEVIAGAATRRRSRPRASPRAREGVLAGLSCGAALWGAMQVAARPESRASGSSACCRIPASATSPRRSSPTEPALRPAVRRRAVSGDCAPRRMGLTGVRCVAAAG